MWQKMQVGSDGGGTKQSYPLVPRMTSSSNDGFTISASTINSTDTPSYKAFDGSENTMWNAGQYTRAWIKVKIPPIPIIVNKIYLYPNYLDGLRVKKYTVQGSYDNNVWIDLFSENLENKNYKGFYRDLNKDKIAPYLYYRVYVEGSYHSTGYHISFKEIQFYYEM